MAELVAAWPAAVGAAVARNSWPARIGRDGTLHVNASSSAWAFELAQLEPTLVDRLREALGAAAPPRIRFVVGAIPELAPPSEQTEVTAVARATAADRAQAAELSSGIEDEELRKLVQRAAAASLARDRARRTF